MKTSVKKRIWILSNLIASIWSCSICQTPAMFPGVEFLRILIWFKKRKEFCCHMSTSSHPRRPRCSQSGQEKRWDESFQVWANEPLGTDSHRTISKNSCRCQLLIGHKNCFILLYPIGEQFLLSPFREFVHNGYCLATLALIVFTKFVRARETFIFCFPNWK